MIGLDQHRAYVEQRAFGKWFAFCPCGWQSQGFENRDGAEARAARHVDNLREFAARCTPAR